MAVVIYIRNISTILSTRFIIKRTGLLLRFNHNYRILIIYMDTTELSNFYNDSRLLFDSGANGESPLFTVCLASYNFESSIEQALKTLLDQTYNDFEIVMHDDCSTDNTCKVAVEYMKKVTQMSPKRVRIYTANTNSGILANRLRGFAKSEGKWLIQTDGDDFSPRNRLEMTNNIIHSLDHEPMLLSTNRWTWYYGTPFDKVIETANIDHQDERWIRLTDIVWPKDMPNGSSGFILNRKVFETFYEVLPTERIIADDPVLARRALLLGDVWVDKNPLYYCRISSASASGGGVSGKPWIIDRYNRFDLLLADLRHISPDHKINPKTQKDIDYWKRRMLLDSRLIDCPNWKWPFLWIKMLFISRAEAKYALKKRIKLIVRGDVNASWKK